jgi:hypothetical protein
VNIILCCLVGQEAHDSFSKHPRITCALGALATLSHSLLNCVVLHVNSLRFLRLDMMYACGLRAVLWIKETRNVLMTQQAY